MEKAGRLGSGPQNDWMATGSPVVTMMTPRSEIGVRHRLHPAETTLGLSLHSSLSLRRPSIVRLRNHNNRHCRNSNTRRHYRNLLPPKTMLSTDLPFSLLRLDRRFPNPKSKMSTCNHRRTLPTVLPSAYPSSLETPVHNIVSAICPDPTHEPQHVNPLSG